MSARRCPICNRRLRRTSWVIRGKRAYDCPADPHTEWVPEPEPKPAKVRKPMKGTALKTMDIRVVVNDSVSAEHLLESLSGSKAVMAACLLENDGFSRLLPSRGEPPVFFDRLGPTGVEAARSLLLNPSHS